MKSYEISNISRGYLNEKYEILGDKVQRELVFKAQNGSQRAKDKLVLSNMAMIKKIASRYKNLDYKFDELVGYGVIGALNGVMCFDLSKKVKVNTYLYTSISNTINREIDNTYNLVRIPVSQNELYRKVKKAFELNPDLSIEELADKLVESTDNIKLLLRTLKISYLDEIVYEKEGTFLTLADVALNKTILKNDFDKVDADMFIKWAIYENEELTDYQKNVIHYKYIDEGELTFDDIATILGKNSRQAIEQQHAKALKLIRKKMKGA